MTVTFASERTTRLMTFSLGVADLALLASNVSGALGQAAMLGDWFTAVVLTLVGACAVLGLLIFRSAPLRVLQRLWSVQAIVLLAATVTVGLIIDGRRLPESYGLTWVSELAVLAGCAGVLAWSSRRAWTLVVILEAALFAVALLSGPHGFTGRAFGDAARQLFFVTFFTAVASALVRAGGLLDNAAETAAAEAGRFAEADARRAGRRRTEMLVHDTVLVALLAYAANPDAPGATVQASEALRAIRSRPGARSHLAAVGPQEFVWQLQAITTSLDARIAFEYTVSGEQAKTIPEDVALRVTEAVSEAIRNSLRHAGASATRQVHADVSADSVRVAVLDDGEGFDADHIPGVRLGVRRGILERMRSLPGGRADVHSAHGYGTVVSIEWRRS